MSFKDQLKQKVIYHLNTDKSLPIEINHRSINKYNGNDIP